MADSLIGPITQELANIITTEIAGVSTVYLTPRDTPPEDNSAMIVLQDFRIVDDTNGKLQIVLRFAVRHVLRRASIDENMSEAYSYIIPYLQAFSAWRHQSLNGLARSVTPRSGGATQFTITGQVFIIASISIEVLTELNISTN